MALSGNELTIAQFLLGKGLSPPEVAGILGNLEVESGFSPTASNANEGAIGIAQWEGGRRTNLQHYAASQGMSESDLNAQLGYLWQELTGSYATSVYNPLKTLSDASAVAALWDAKFEVSSGSARQQRESDATQILAQMNGVTAGPLPPPDTTGGTPTTGGTSTGNANNGVINNAAFSAANTGITPGSTSVEQASLLGDIGSGLEMINPLYYLKQAGSAISDTKDAITALANVVGFIADAFQKFLWLFQPGHFIKFCLYVGGIAMVIFGIWIMVKGSGEDKATA